MAPIADWLRSTRLRQVMPGTEDPWTQDYFLDRLAEETGWHLHRPSYSKYENDKQTPERDTLRKFVDFWAARGEPGPDLTPTPPAEAPPDLATALAALATELRESRLARESMEVRLRALEAELQSRRGLPAGGGSPERSAPRV